VTSEAIQPPATLGILGGGQLGRYFVIAARTMGYRTMVLEPDPHAPAGAVADVHLRAAYDDRAALQQLAQQCAVVTTEFENPPADALLLLAASTVVRPSPSAIAIVQDRRSEKRFLAGIGVPTAPFALIESVDDLSDHGISFPAILKTARLGYDGKGQLTVADDRALADGWHELGRVACVLEQRLSLQREVSVVLGRSPDGHTAAFAVADNTHVRGILDLTVVPASAGSHVTADGVDATGLAVAISEALDYVGVMAVEMFVVEGRLLVNEIAPRPHNSGHWTLDAALTSQFEQQVRAVCGLQLGDTSMATPAVAMVNLLGDMWDGGEPDWTAATASPGAHLHLYGKIEPRPGRKMGHVTVTAGSPDDAIRGAVACRDNARRDIQLDQ
jgi:5-(carboxyamino)imidazole ribonucleotide synthase